MRQQQQKIQSEQDRITITLPVSLGYQLREYARNNNISISLIIREAIEEKMNRLKR